MKRIVPILNVSRFRSGHQVIDLDTDAGIICSGEWRRIGSKMQNQRLMREYHKEAWTSAKPKLLKLDVGPGTQIPTTWSFVELTSHIYK